MARGLCRIPWGGGQGVSELRHQLWCLRSRPRSLVSLGCVFLGTCEPFMNTTFEAQKIFRRDVLTQPWERGWFWPWADPRPSPSVSWRVGLGTKVLWISYLEFLPVLQVLPSSRVLAWVDSPRKTQNGSAHSERPWDPLCVAPKYSRPGRGGVKGRARKRIGPVGSGLGLNANFESIEAWGSREKPSLNYLINPPGTRLPSAGLVQGLGWEQWILDSNQARSPSPAPFLHDGARSAK